MQTGRKIPILPRMWFSFPNNKPGEFAAESSQQCENCDCACPVDLQKVGVSSIARAVEQIRLVPDIRYQTTAGLYRVKVNSEVAVAGVACASPIVLDGEAIRLLDSFTVPQLTLEAQKLFYHWEDNLLEKAVAAFIAFGLLMPVGKQDDSQIAPHAASVLSAWLHLTDACPLQCAYCYVRWQEQRPNGRTRWMSTDTAQRAVEAIFRSAAGYGFSSVKLKYAGGEPSLNFPALLAAQKRAELLAPTSGLILDAVLLSNGLFLSDCQIETLYAHNVRISISLDGIGAAHDRQRPLASGDGSFQHVSRTIDRLVGRGIKPHISITITGRNLGALPATLKYVLSNDLPFTLNFYREHDTSIGVEGLGLDDGEMIKGLKHAFTVLAGRLPHYSLLSRLADRADLKTPHAYTCGVGHNYLVVDPAGNVSKCQMTMHVPVANITTEDPLALIKADCMGVQNPSVDEKDGCQGCTWRYYCAGGCPLLTYRNFGRYDTRSPYCRVYQAIIPEILRLEALRLLRYQEPWDFSV